MEEILIVNTEAGEDGLLSVFSNLANIIIALANLFLAYHILRYQQNKDRTSDQRADELHNQNINLEWFKVLIVQPNLAVINEYFSALNKLRTKILASEMSEEDRVDLINFIKDESSNFRKGFLSSLIIASPILNSEAQDIIDKLADSITHCLDDETINLKDANVYDLRIGDTIQKARNSFIALIFNFKGTA